MASFPRVKDTQVFHFVELQSQRRRDTRERRNLGIVCCELHACGININLHVYICSIKLGLPV